MTPITNEQAIVLRGIRAETYAMKKNIVKLVEKILKPPCPHESLENDLIHSNKCEYCKVFRVARELTDAADLLTTVMDDALVNGPIPQD